MEAWLTAASAWYGPAAVGLLLGLAGVEVARGREGSTLHLVTNAACWVLGGLAVRWLPDALFETPLLRPFDLIGVVAGPGAVLLAGLLSLDLFTYAMHRLEHRVPLLWRLHALHHSDTIVDASTGVRHHPGEAIAVALTGGVLFGLLGLPVWAMATAGMIMLGWAMVQHADLSWPAAVDRVIGTVLVTPGLHRVHHSEEAHHHGANFGTLLSIWDRVFGTFMRPDGTALRYGIGPAGAESHRLGVALLLPMRLPR